MPSSEQQGIPATAPADAGDRGAGDGDTGDVAQVGHHEVVLCVRLAPGESFTGSVGRSTQTRSYRFHGWIDFMGAVNALRRAASESAST